MLADNKLLYPIQDLPPQGSLQTAAPNLAQEMQGGELKDEGKWN